MGEAMGNSPEFKLKGMKTPQEKVAYLQSLAKDSNFDPKEHKPLLEQFSKDPDPEVAAAAKDLLDKAQ
jgi:hypothetical protein